ncbi:hypothetical protein ACEC001_1895 [Escherichia phage vB_EcoM_EC001]|uniref:Uncharacterized protein n=1 Tax=Escherichia phage vB_EcoM_EC001 TaxID=2739754 RepID=A0A7D4Z362_9CAUD|nr:hypothetical protein ACEC001_1895 [Escherichia phage vB_EcoM_EC001]
MVILVKWVGCIICSLVLGAGAYALGAILALTQGWF